MATFFIGVLVGLVLGIVGGALFYRKNKNKSEQVIALAKREIDELKSRTS